MSRRKITDHFECPLVLDMTPHVAPTAAPRPYTAGSEPGEQSSGSSSAGGLSAPPEDNDVAAAVAAMEIASAAEQQPTQDRTVLLADAWRDVVKSVFDAKKETEGHAPPEAEAGGEPEDAAGAPAPGAPEAAGTPGAAEGDQSMVYDLVGVVLHSGSGYSGHYISLIRDQALESKWDPADLSSADSCKGPASKAKRDAAAKAKGAKGAKNEAKDRGPVPPDAKGVIRWILQGQPVDPELAMPVRLNRRPRALVSIRSHRKTEACPS